MKNLFDAIKAAPSSIRGLSPDAPSEKIVGDVARWLGLSRVSKQRRGEGGKRERIYSLEGNALNQRLHLAEGERSRVKARLEGEAPPCYNQETVLALGAPPCHSQANRSSFSSSTLTVTPPCHPPLPPGLQWFASLPAQEQKDVLLDLEEGLADAPSLPSIYPLTYADARVLVTRIGAV